MEQNEKPIMAFKWKGRDEKRAMELIANRRPHTLNEMRAQYLWQRGDFPNKEEALKFVNTLSDEEYMDYINGNKPL